MKFLSQIQPISLREQVVEQVRMAIVEGRLKPNDHVTEAILTEQLGVSRTPVREALILLEREGLVVFMPNRGAFVRAFNEGDVRDVFAMRTTLENKAAELCIDTLTEVDYARLEALIEQQRQAIEQKDVASTRSTDMNFHRTLVYAGGNRILVRNWEEIVAQIALLLNLWAAALPDHDEFQSVRDHRDILAAFRSRDLSAVQHLNREINDRVARDCQRALEVLQSEGPE